MLSQRIDRLTSSLVRDILAAAQRSGMISFAGGLPAAEAMPRPDWDAVPAAAGQYGTTEGEPELREAIASRARGLGLHCDAAQVLVLSGSQQGLDLAAKLFIDPGTRVITEAPTYVAALQTFTLFGAECLGVSVEPGGIDAERLRAVARAGRPAFAYLVPTFQNPSGTCYDAAARAAVARALDDLGLPLLEDEPYRDLAYEPVDREPLCARLARASWIYQGSFSKTFLPGARVGYVIATPDLYPHLVRLKQAADLHTNRLGQWLAWRWLSAPGHDACLDDLRARYAAKRDAMQAALVAHFSGGAAWRRPAGGLFFWLRLHEAIDTRPLLTRTLARGVAFMPGEVFFPGDQPPLGYLRLNFSHATPEQMERGLSLLAGEIARAGTRVRT